MPNRDKTGPNYGAGRGKGLGRGGCCDEMGFDKISIAKMFWLKKHCSGELNEKDQKKMLIEEEELLVNELERVRKKLEKMKK